MTARASSGVETNKTDMKYTENSVRPGFTLIEMLAVITIIVILAGVVVGGMGFVKDKQNQSKAELQVKLIASALERYKLATGSYPASIDPQGRGNTNDLYRALYWEGAQEGSNGEIYLPDLDPDHNGQGWTEGTGENVIIVDPWGSEYRYRSGESARNPDFDLWSVGKDGVTNPDVPNHQDNNDDVRN